MVTVTKQSELAIKPDKLYGSLYALPETWTGAIGLLKGKNINPLRFQKQIRKGWARRMLKLSIKNGN